MPIFRLLGSSSTLQINFYTLRQRLFGGAKKIGVDQFGNHYFEKPRKDQKRPTRWVLYANDIEATEVPPEWHGWLHYQTDEIPNMQEESPYRKEWQKPHAPNKTGTLENYMPPGHPLKGAKRDQATGDYEAWKP